MDFDPITIMWVAIILVLAPAIAGGWVAYKKNDYVARGVVISVFSSWYGPLFMYFTRPSLAKQGNQEDIDTWPSTGPLACIVFIATCVAVYIVGKLL